jgi:pimeloyl-ACP methyl ester carboxylesterase
MNWREVLWHKWLQRPFRLKQTLEIGDRRGAPVVLLHGLASTTNVWQPLITELTKPETDIIDGEPRPAVRLMAFDLLGHGKSPKPQWLDYVVDDHAQAVIAALRRSRLRQPAILVGHSMGCLVAVRVARLRPDLVRHLILYEMPLYAGLPEKRSYRLRLAIYFKLYNRVIAYEPIFTGPGKGKAQRIAEERFGLNFTNLTWKPFINSLKHTIMEQTTAQDIKRLVQPMDVIYGTRDRLVIRGKTTVIFGSDARNITAHTVKASHNVNHRAAVFLAQRIVAAVNGTSVSQAVAKSHATEKVDGVNGHN